LDESELSEEVSEEDDNWLVAELSLLPIGMIILKKMKKGTGLPVAQGYAVQLPMQVHWHAGHQYCRAGHAWAGWACC
jgi:hypothetical protein